MNKRIIGLKLDYSNERSVDRNREWIILAIVLGSNYAVIRYDVVAKVAIF